MEPHSLVSAFKIGEAALFTDLGQAKNVFRLQYAPKTAVYNSRLQELSLVTQTDFLLALDNLS